MEVTDRLQDNDTPAIPTQQSQEMAAELMDLPAAHSSILVTRYWNDDTGRRVSWDADRDCELEQIYRITERTRNLYILRQENDDRRPGK